MADTFKLAQIANTLAASSGDLETPDQPLKGFIGYNMKRALSIIQADLARVLAGYELRAVSFSALSIVVGDPGLTQTQLADALQIERSNLVTILDELAGRNLIIRAPVANDRRRHALMPTAQGKKLQAAAQADVRAHEEALFGAITPAEQAELQRILHKFRITAGKLTAPVA